MEGVERAVLVLNGDGDRVLFASPCCRIELSTEDGYTFTDLCPTPSWVREAQANVELMGNQ